jgi:hypothetical protein
MKKFLLITTALVALGTAPVLAQSSGTATAGGTSATIKTAPGGTVSGSAAVAKPKAAKAHKVSASKAKGKAMMHHASARSDHAMGRPHSRSLNAKEKPITAQLNKEAQARAGVPGATVAANPMLNQQPQMGQPAPMAGQQTMGARPDATTGTAAGVRQPGPGPNSNSNAANPNNQTAP